MRTKFLTAAILMSSVWSTPAFAQDDTFAEDATATIRFYADSRLAGDWFGEGQLQLSTDFCAASSTGRFRLRIQPFANPQLLGSGAGPTLTLTTDAGSSDTSTFSGAIPLDLAGRNLAAAIGCGAGANVRLTITFPENSLTASQAGSYFDSLQISVEPA